MNQPPEIEPPVEGENEQTADPSASALAPTPQDRASQAPATGDGDSSHPATEAKPAEPKPSFVFLGIVSSVSLALDLGSKWWALHTLEKPLPNGMGLPAPIELTPWLTMVLARNRGGAWGLLQSANEEVRKPFFLIISVLAIGFIVYLYRRVHPQQHALKWGLPLVLGGAIGNLVDRVRYGWVVDFIDYKAAWVRVLNEQIARLFPTHAVTDHWPTFNIADVAICVGVGLMAIDMFTSRAVHRAEAEKHEAAKTSADQDGAGESEPLSSPGSLPPPDSSESPDSAPPDVRRTAEQSKV